MEISNKRIKKNSLKSIFFQYIQVRSVLILDQLVLCCLFNPDFIRSYFWVISALMLLDCLIQGTNDPSKTQHCHNLEVGILLAIHALWYQ